MQNEKILKQVQKIGYVALTLFVGVFMLYGGYQKFAKPIPAPTQMIAQVEKEGAAKMTADIETLKIRNYIFGMKQTNYFWQFLGICELLFGVLLLSQYMRFLAAVLLMPITVHIFLFHLFLEPNDWAELLQTGALLLANALLIAKEYPRWKHLVWLKNI
ncbi:DoxX family protein [Hugenholtzia roseola]|uniref:DoxX family protein n=1 Tax=Hugenholtzia roseola TaxID=1002 RepID=UPI000478A358|nr:DoxX family protein [Hugenholtzia roseola]